MDLAGWVGLAVVALVDRQVEEFQRCLLCREVSALSCGPPESGVERLDGVGIGYDITGRFAPVAARNLGFGWSGSGRLEESARTGRSTP